MMSPTLQEATRLAARLDNIDKRRQHAIAKVAAKYEAEREAAMADASPEALAVLEVLSKAEAI
jgi:hypothetical protein